MRSLSPNIFQNTRHCSFGIISTYPKQYPLYTIYSDSFAYPLTEVGLKEDCSNLLHQIPPIYRICPLTGVVLKEGSTNVLNQI